MLFLRGNKTDTDRQLYEGRVRLFYNSLLNPSCSSWLNPKIVLSLGELRYFNIHSTIQQEFFFSEIRGQLTSNRSRFNTKFYTKISNSMILKCYTLIESLNICQLFYVRSVFFMISRDYLTNRIKIICIIFFSFFK